jgi:hypothetical protein
VSNGFTMPQKSRCNAGAAPTSLEQFSVFDPRFSLMPVCQRSSLCISENSNTTEHALVMWFGLGWLMAGGSVGSCGNDVMVDSPSFSLLMSRRFVTSARL